MATTIGTGTVFLFSARTTDGTSTATATNFRSGRAQVQVYGTFGGGTVTISLIAANGSTSIPQKDIGNTAISTAAAAMYVIEVPYGTSLTATLTGSSGASINVALLELKEMR